MTGTKTGIIVPDADALRRDQSAFDDFIASCKPFDAVMIFSQAPVNASTVSLRDRLPKSFLAGPKIMSERRLARLCDDIHIYKDGKLQKKDRPTLQKPEYTRIGFIVSNGYGLGHVTRTRAIAAGLAPYADQAFMSFSGAFVQNVFYLPSAQYLKLDPAEGFAYTREAVSRFLESANPTHIMYDGNVLPDGLLSALAARPHIHLTWVRRGMWQPDVAPHHMAQQALVDLLLQPGDLAESYDTGETWNKRKDYAPAGEFLKTLPIEPRNDGAPDLDIPAQSALIMLGSAADVEMLEMVAGQVRLCGLHPVIAHWPMAQGNRPQIENATVIECMPLAPHYHRFEVIIAASGYNTFHELIAGGHPVVFVPQEDVGRDNQYARARWAVDRGLAQICRRGDLRLLAHKIPLARCHANTIGWFGDWDVLADAMGLKKEFFAVGQTRTNIKPRLLQAMHKRRAARKAGPYEFVLALNMNTRAFLKKAADKNAIIITNSVDPVVLRREGYRYLWLNDAHLSPLGVKRQFLNWLNIWRPEKLSRLG